MDFEASKARKALRQASRAGLGGPWRAATLGPLVRRWRHAFTRPAAGRSDTRGEHPCLGRFRIQPLNEADAWVRRVEAFNFSSVVSMGPRTTSASGHKHSIPALGPGGHGHMPVFGAAARIVGTRARRGVRPVQKVLAAIASGTMRSAFGGRKASV
jgi:hypothetical protein